MPRKLKSGLSHETLRRLTTEFPTHEWTDEELAELISQEFGVITGFEEILRDIEKLSTHDLEDIEPACPMETE